MCIFHIFMYNYLLKSYVQSHIHFFVVYVHFQSVYVHFVNKCALSYLSEKNAGCDGRQRFDVSKKNATCVRARTDVQSNPYLYVHWYVQIKTKSTFVCTKSLLLYTFYNEPVCTIICTIRGYP